LGLAAARLHLARLAFDAGPEDTALAHLQDYLSWRLRGAAFTLVRLSDTSV
jgi:hypothetical protein